MRKRERDKTYTESNLRETLLVQKMQSYKHWRERYFIRKSKRLKRAISRFMCRDAQD